MDQTRSLSRLPSVSNSAQSKANHRLYYSVDICQKELVPPRDNKTADANTGGEGGICPVYIKIVF